MHQQRPGLACQAPFAEYMPHHQRLSVFVAFNLEQIVAAACAVVCAAVVQHQALTALALSIVLLAGARSLFEELA